MLARVEAEYAARESALSAEREAMGVAEAEALTAAATFAALSAEADAEAEAAARTSVVDQPPAVADVLSNRRRHADCATAAEASAAAAVCAGRRRIHRSIAGRTAAGCRRTRRVDGLRRRRHAADDAHCRARSRWSARRLRWRPATSSASSSSLRRASWWPTRRRSGRAPFPTSVACAAWPSTITQAPASSFICRRARQPLADDVQHRRTSCDRSAIEADGLIVVAGPRSSGKSALLSAFVDVINNTRYDHVITIESQIRRLHEKRLSFISQREVRGDGDAIAKAARAALREGPDVLVIEDLRAPEALVAALDAARAGRLVFGSISAADRAGRDRTIDRRIPRRPPIAGPGVARRGAARGGRADSGAEDRRRAHRGARGAAQQSCGPQGHSRRRDLAAADRDRERPQSRHAHDGRCARRARSRRCRQHRGRLRRAHPIAPRSSPPSSATASTCPASRSEPDRWRSPKSAGVFSPPSRRLDASSRAPRAHRRCCARLRRASSPTRRPRVSSARRGAEGRRSSLQRLYAGRVGPAGCRSFARGIHRALSRRFIRSARRRRPDDARARPPDDDQFRTRD